jgi:hypothetical protein
MSLPSIRGNERNTAGITSGVPLGRPPQARLNWGVAPSGAVARAAEGELWVSYEYACTSATSIEAEGVVWVGTVWSDSSCVATWSSMMIS